jgi:hypothetical protein
VPVKRENTAQECRNNDEEKHMIHNKTGWAAVIGLAILLSGCSSSNKTDSSSTKPQSATTAQKAPAAAPTPSSCAIVRKEDVEAVLEEPVKPPETMGNESCKYVGVNASPYKSVTVFFSEAPARDRWQVDIENHARMVPSKPIPVEGVGEAALFWKDELNASHFDVLKDGTSATFIVDLGRLGSKDDSRKLKISRELADKAFQRIEGGH